MEAGRGRAAWWRSVSRCACAIASPHRPGSRSHEHARGVRGVLLAPAIAPPVSLPSRSRPARRPAARPPVPPQRHVLAARSQDGLLPVHVDRRQRAHPALAAGARRRRHLRPLHLCRLAGDRARLGADRARPRRWPAASRLLVFRRIGRKVVAEIENPRFRATGAPPPSRRASATASPPRPSGWATSPPRRPDGRPAGRHLAPS